MDLTRLEEKIAHLAHANDELSDVVAQQQARIERLERRLHMVMEREAEREIERSGTIALGDERPPHW